jgi:hypothetical protein
MPSLPPAAELYLQFTRRFEQASAKYMVRGSVAAMLYSLPRFTNDIDLIAHLDAAGAVRLPQLFPADEYYCPPTEIITSEAIRERRGHFNILHIASGFKADVYLCGHDPFQKWALDHSHRVELGDSSLVLAPIEYVIVMKLEFFREGKSEKHLRDIRAMLEVSPQMIDMARLEQIISERELNEEWRKAHSISL